jgi:tetratricopeptide (TPR) repeat protein
MGRTTGHSGGISMRLMLWLPVAALATIANEQLHGMWNKIFGVLIGVGWVTLGDAIIVGQLPRRRSRQRRALEQLIATGDPHTAAEASLNLGAMLAASRDLAGARVAWQRALDTGSPDVVAKAAFNLGLLEHRHGEPTAAVAAYRRAISYDHPDYRPMSANNLAQVLERIGDLDGARAAYRLAIDSGHPEQARIATQALARMR